MMMTVLAKVWSPCFLMIMAGSFKCQGDRHVSDEMFAANSLDSQETCDGAERNGIDNKYGSPLLTSLISPRRSSLLIVTGEGAGKYRYSTFGGHLIGIREVVGVCKMRHLRNLEEGRLMETFLGQDRCLLPNQRWLRKVRI
jgi:hypothetical protein